MKAYQLRELPPGTLVQFPNGSVERKIISHRGGHGGRRTLLQEQRSGFQTRDFPDTHYVFILEEADCDTPKTCCKTILENVEYRQLAPGQRFRLGRRSTDVEFIVAKSPTRRAVNLVTGELMTPTHTQLVYPV
jgi:hypothetical protein